MRKTPTELLQTVKCAANRWLACLPAPSGETPYAGAFDFSVAVDARKVRAFLAEQQASPQCRYSPPRSSGAPGASTFPKNRAVVMVDTGYVSSGIASSRFRKWNSNWRRESGRPARFCRRPGHPSALVPHDVSKAERGYQLFLQQASGPQKALPSPLNVKHSAADAFRLLASQGMQTWQANLMEYPVLSRPGIRASVRVSLRRLNSLSRFSSPPCRRAFSKMDKTGQSCRRSRAMCVTWM